MDNSQRLQLDKLIRANNVEDVTEDIRERKHSQLIKNDISVMLSLKKQYARLSRSNPDQFNTMLESRCNFLFNNYTDIFNRIKKDELNLDIMWQFLEVLHNIEEGNVDQHEGAYHIGKLLKEIYIDSAKTRSQKLDELAAKRQKSIPKKPPAKNLSWSEFKNMSNNMNNPNNF